MAGVADAQKFKQQIEYIMHVRGNVTKELTEMAVIVDCSMPEEKARDSVKWIAATLKRMGESFNNVRLNLVQWRTDGNIECIAEPLIAATFARGLEDYCRIEEEKHLEPLLEYLRKFQARSKIVILVTEGKYGIQDKEEAVKLLFPFLGKKMLIFSDKEISENLGIRNIMINV